VDEEMLAAAGLAAVWCALPEQWPVFLEWARENGYMSRDASPSREFMLRCSAAIELVIREAEAELLIRRREDEM
jgi:hypothetical protein